MCFWHASSLAPLTGQLSGTLVNLLYLLDTASSGKAELKEDPLRARRIHAHMMSYVYMFSPRLTAPASSSPDRPENRDEGCKSFRKKDLYECPTKGPQKWDGVPHIWPYGVRN